MTCIPTDLFNHSYFRIFSNSVKDVQQYTAVVVVYLPFARMVNPAGHHGQNGMGYGMGYIPL